MDKDIKASPGNEDRHYKGNYQPFEVAVGRGDGVAVCKFHIDKYLNREPKPHPDKTPEEVRKEDINKAQWYNKQLFLIETLGAKRYIREVWKPEEFEDLD